MERAMVRNKRTEREHEIAMRELYIQLRGRGIHSLSIAQRMDIAHYCLYRGASDIYERSSFSSSFYREECVAAFNYQSAIYRHRITPRQGINFLTPQISQEKKAGIQINIEPFFTALNSTIELEQEPLHLLNLGIDCLNIIGEMVAKDNRDRWIDWSYKYYKRVKKKCGFVTDWSLFDEMDYTKMCDKHPYNIPMTIRNFCVAWGYRAEVVVVGERWLDIWQACDALIRNSKNKDGEGDHHRFIERLVRPGHETFEQYTIEEFLHEDDSEYNGSDGEYDEDIWYLINGS